jgi:hypothetical protein
MQGPRSGEITRALARAREGWGGETRRRSTVARRDARRLTVFAPAKEVHTLMPYRELRVVPLKLTSPTTARNDERRRVRTTCECRDLVTKTYPKSRAAAGAFRRTRLGRA